jgi:chemotaxis protein CheD
MVKGSAWKNIVAKMAGGAKMFDHEEPDTENIGMENVRSVKKILSKEKIPLICEDVGGGHGRSVAFYLESGRLVVSAIDRENMEI